MQRLAAAKSREKTYAGDWIFHFIEGVADKFDRGWDFTACGVLKFYKSLGGAGVDAFDLCSGFYCKQIGRHRITTNKDPCQR